MTYKWRGLGEDCGLELGLVQKVDVQKDTQLAEVVLRAGATFAAAGADNGGRLASKQVPVLKKSAVHKNHVS